MPAISIFNGIFCNEGKVMQDVLQSTKHLLITDEMIIENASNLSGISKEKLSNAFTSKSSVFNNFTHEKARIKVNRG